MNGKDIALIGAYFNPVHPNVAKIDNGIAVFRDYISLAKTIGCNYVGSETGSYNGDPWIYHPMNHSDEALDRVVSTFSDLADFASLHGVNIAIEGAFGHVCHTPERLFDAIDRIGRNNIRIIFDIYNYLDISNVDTAYEILERGLKLFGDRILLFRIKDFVIGENKLIQCGVGKGVLDYDRILKAIYKHNSDAILVLEGTVGEDIDYAVSYLNEKINKVTHYSKES
jgi:sugar phosphate isomerase/epimerase